MHKNKNGETRAADRLLVRKLRIEHAWKRPLQRHHDEADLGARGYCPGHGTSQERRGHRGCREAAAGGDGASAEERCEGQECVGSSRYRLSLYQINKKTECSEDRLNDINK